MRSCCCHTMIRGQYIVIRRYWSRPLQVSLVFHPAMELILPIRHSVSSAHTLHSENLMTSYLMLGVLYLIYSILSMTVLFHFWHVCERRISPQFSSWGFSLFWPVEGVLLWRFSLFKTHVKKQRVLYRVQPLKPPDIYFRFWAIHLKEKVSHLPSE